MPRLLSRRLAAAACALVAGCVSISRPQPLPPAGCWSDPEQLAERTRFLPGVAEPRALDAAERLLRLTGGGDMKIRRTPQELSGEFSRDRWLYLLLYADRAVVHEQWRVAARAEPGGTRACVQVAGHYFTDTFILGAEPMRNALYPASARGERDALVPPPQAYAVDFDTFWARLEYLAGLRGDWASCPASAVREDTARSRAEIDPLCHRLADRAMPHH